MAAALSACRLAGRFRGRRRGRRSGGIAASRSAKTVRSCRLAPVRQRASGVPGRSPTSWRFVPGTRGVLPRSRPGLRAPFGAGKLALSRHARSPTPAACHAQRAPGKRRQPVSPEPQSISGGRSSHGMPVLRTKLMPVRQARSGPRAARPSGFKRQQRFDDRPQVVGEQWLAHAARRASTVPRFC